MLKNQNNTKTLPNENFLAQENFSCGVFFDIFFQKKGASWNAPNNTKTLPNENSSRHTF